MLLSDNQIEQYVNEQNMISPFINSLVREEDGRRVISHSLSSYGYDIRLSPRDFRVFRHIPGRVVDPKNFDPKHLEPAELLEDENGRFFIIPANSYALGVAIEKLQMPPNVTAIALGKSTYARVGVICCVTPAESGWIGHLTLEFSNASSADVRIYAGEGVCQLLFLRGEPCGTTYSDRAGKYQGQGEEVVFAKV